MSRRRRTAALAAILLIAAAAVAIVLAQPGSRTASAAGSGVPAGFTTATVERRTLTERSTVDGTLGYAGAAEIYDRLAGTFTWLPAVGAVIHRGGTLFKVNNLPVALMYGDVPAYRALEEGVSDGPDVRELNANLVLLGFDPSGAIDVDEHFSGATAAAVRRWQHAEGLSETGQVELGRVVFAPGARRVTTVHVSIGQDPPGSGADRSGSSSPSKSEAEGGSGSRSPSSGEGSANKGSGTSGSGKEGSDKKGSGPSGSGKEGSDKKGSGTSGSGKEGSGKEGSGKEGSGSGGSPSGGGAAPELVLSTTADDQIVTLQLKATQQELAHVGERVPVALPDGRTVHGRVSEVGSVASE